MLARGLRSAGATPPTVPDSLDESSSRSMRPLAVSVKTARELIGVGNTSMWALIKSGQVDVIRPGRRTLVVLASLEALIATLAASARQGRQVKPHDCLDPKHESSLRRGPESENAR